MTIKRLDQYSAAVGLQGWRIRTISKFWNDWEGCAVESISWVVRRSPLECRIGAVLLQGIGSSPCGCDPEQLDGNPRKQQSRYGRQSIIPADQCLPSHGRTAPQIRGGSVAMSSTLRTAVEWTGAGLFLVRTWEGGRSMGSGPGWTDHLGQECTE